MTTRDGIASTAPATAPSIVKTNSGRIQGNLVTSFLDRRPFYSFRGIPYAKPPIGPLRFKAPQKIEPWSGVLNASNFGALCLQPARDATDFQGDENCLFLNVYTPYLSSQEKLPVIFYIHGGGFMIGSGAWLGPEILLDQDVVLVTINYRLGPFGFLSLNLPEYSGNMGLKDQLLALQWVNENIDGFGGDWNRITIHGHSAGAVSAHLHTLLPKSRNLFQRAIISSGCVMSPWSCSTRNHIEIVSKLIANEKGVNGKDVRLNEIVEWLQTVDGNHLGVHSFFPEYESIEGVKGMDLVWAPVIEREDAVDAIFTRPIESYMHDTTDIDSLFGYTSAESIIGAKHDINDADKLKSFDENFAVQLPLYGLNYTYTSSKYKEIMKEVRKFYFGDEPVNRDTLPQFVRLLDDVLFIYGTDKSVKAQAARSTGKTFYYQFSVELELNFLRKRANASAHGLSGATHIDDLFYLFKSAVYVPEGGYENVKADSKEAQMVRTMTKFIMDFVKNGNPVPNSKLAGLKPIQGDAVNYVDITNEGLLVGENPHNESIQFWNELLNKYF